MGYVTESISAASASSQYSDAHGAANAFNTGTSLTGSSENNTWAADNAGAAWLKAQFASAKVITRILYHNFFDVVSGSWDAGAKDFSLWGSNDGVSWTELVVSANVFAQHVNNDEPDPKYITVNNASAYAYYKIEISSNYGNGYTVGLRRVELQSGSDDPPPPPTGPPTVTTAAISSVTASTASGGGNVTSNGGGTVSSRGVCWSTSENPTIANSKTTDGSGTGTFTSGLTGLTAPTTYYVRAYATNEYGTGYGAQTSFSTVAPPTVTTASPASKIKNTSATIRGEIVSTGGIAPTARGVCYNTSGSPTTADAKIEETGSFAAGSFAETMTGLTRSTTYYARAYAINTEGTSYGAVISFTTLSVESPAEPQLRLADTFYLPRAGRYADPKNTNDRLPLVYGDLTDGAAGIWQLPCIDTVNFVYCFAAFSVLSAAGGNSIAVYADGVLVDPANYIFDEDSDYEGEGPIATVTFTADQKNAVITARGKGKVLSGTTVMTNIVDIVSDVLTVQNNFTSDLFEGTARARARQVFEAQGYAAAGVIADDAVFWDIITEMMSSFIGGAYLNGSGKLILEIDDGTMSLQGATIIRKWDAMLLGARQRVANIINQCPAHYAYNYAAGAFMRETNTAAHADAISQGIHGVREPNTPLQLYWCRNITNAQAMQDIVVGKFKDPIYEIEIDVASLKYMHLDVGDHFVLTVDSLYDKQGSPLINNYWRIVSVKPNYSSAVIGIRALQTPYYMTVAYLADGSYLAAGSVLAGGDRDMTIY